MFQNSNKFKKYCTEGRCFAVFFLQMYLPVIFFIVKLRCH